jgi:hypothetical protein
MRALRGARKVLRVGDVDDQPQVYKIKMHWMETEEVSAGKRQS